ncbi:uncharacterized protein LOC122051500 [Zingiber officinale]|uniref:uncharacterized protein LOC122051500 n=1 Tax=Zingiber officinale TaxID=94328 RepID=UPI001C4C1962|nr:uncharacterized protein LOC122051500 [Zingiber officinale]
MYAQAGLHLPSVFSHGFFHDYSGGHYSYLPFSDEGFLSHRFYVGVEDGRHNLANMAQAPSVSEYDMGGEGDLFKAPEPILEDPALDPMANAMSIISGGGDVITETIKAADIESIQNDHLTDIYFECKKDLMEKSEIEEPISQLLEELKIPAVGMAGVPPPGKIRRVERSIQKSASSECLSSLEWFPSCSRRLDFLDFQGLDFEAALGLRRASSEGDVQNLGNKSTNSRNATTVCSSFEQPFSISENKTELRLQKLSRYREKKSKRNFGRKIKYACRKALADSQPRIRGRFAKTEDNISTQIVNYARC